MTSTTQRALEVSVKNAVDAVLDHWCGSEPCACVMKGQCLFSAWITLARTKDPQAEAFQGPVNVHVSLSKPYAMVRNNVTHPEHCC